MEAVSVSATKPLVTFAIATYNQQGLIEEAIRSAFQQSYVPLEILISDDCSTDKTYDVIQEIVKSYNGPHTITLNQNPENLGIGRHWDQIGRAAKGELIIHAAGDDISLPFRTEILVKVWQENIGNLMLISSDGMKMTFDGKLLEPHIGTRSREKRNFQSKIRRSNLDTRETHICGFSLATDKRLYQVFEPLSDRFWSEDDILPRRALILGKIAYIPNILVYYRDNGLSKGAKRNQMAYMDLHLAQAQSRLSTVLQSIKDVEILQRSDKDKLLVVLQRQKASAQRRLALIEGSLTRSSLACLLQIGSKREYGIGRLDYLRIFTVRWLPSVFFGIRPLVLKFRARVNRIQWPKG